MLKYNLIAAFRYIKRSLSFSLINISGLSIGLALVIILLLWIQYELSFDKFNDNAGRIFRVVAEFEHETYADNFAGTPAPLGRTLKNDIPEVTDYVRFGSLGRILVSYENEQFWEEIELADPSVFRIFSFKLLYGNPEKALDDPGSIVISEAKARKYFGGNNPLGKTLFLGDSKAPHIITGVMKDIPANSQLQFDFLCTFAKMKSNIAWGQWNYLTYILAKDERSSTSISKKLPDVLKKNTDITKTRLHIQPLTSIHLHSRLRDDLSTNRDIKTVYIIGSICLLVLIVACINYMNLATARYTRRGKEAGLRKVAGATNSNLVGQFLFESFAITFSAFLIALFLCSLSLPIFSKLTNIPLNKESLLDFNSLVKFVFLIIIVSFISGSYPAFMLSAVNPISSLRDDYKMGKTLSVKGLRKGLIIFQFFVSIVLIASTLVIQYQMAFIRNKDLGLTPDQIVVVPIYQNEVKPKYELFKKEILAYPYIINASAMGYFPGNNGYNQNVWWEGLQKDDQSNMMSWLPVDRDFLSTLKIEIVKGENFPENITGKGINSYILNESAAKMIGWSEPIGKQFDIVGKGKVIGIVKDFNFKSLYSGIEPVALTFYPEVFDNLMIKISVSNIPGTIEFLREKWKSLFSEAPFEYSFLSDDFQKMYEKEALTLKIITYVSIMSLFISCIGLFGLVLFTLDRRIKEIGLRKVAGSTSGGVVIMLNMEFIKWLLVSFIFSCPIIIYFMKRWLESFAYRIKLSWWMFAFAGIITFIISLLTVSWHTWHIASKNPAECLKHE
jgi:putative ABC transport system permease protein